MADVSVDIIGRNGVRGEVASQLTNNALDLGAKRPWVGTDGKAYVSVYKGSGDVTDGNSYTIKMVANGTLRRDEWIKLDEAIQPVARQRLIGVADLTSRGLTYNLGNAMGTTVLEWHDMTDGMEAILNMDGVSRAQNDRPEFGTHYLPIPIIHSHFEINARSLATSRNMGNPIDTIMAEQAARRVAEKLESLLFTNTSYKFGGGTIYSYVNHPNRNLVTLASDWRNSGVTGKQMVEDVSAMKQASLEDLHYGPWILYIPIGFETLLDMDYSDAKGNNTIRERIMKIGGLLDIKPHYMLNSNEMLLVQMTSDTVRMINGFGLQNVQWGTEGDWVTKYKVLTIQVPQIRSDADGRSGIIHASFTTPYSA